MNNQAERVSLPRWVAEMALEDHKHHCPYCGCGREELCRDEDFTETLERALEQ